MEECTWGHWLVCRGLTAWLGQKTQNIVTDEKSD